MDGNPIHVVLVDKSSDQIMVPTSFQHPIKLEIVVLDGDFPDKESWTSEEFNRHIVKERTGKRPLLAGELNLTLRDGIAPIGDIEFTDNSSWIRSRKFRVAVRVAPTGNNPSLRIREGMTDAFIVKDHRGECESFKLSVHIYQTHIFYTYKYVHSLHFIFNSFAICKAWLV